MQPGKSDAGALFTSSVSSNAFGPRGTQTILAKITIGAAFAFMLFAFLLSQPFVTGTRSVLETTGGAITTEQNANANTEANANTADANANTTANSNVTTDANTAANSNVNASTNTANTANTAVSNANANTKANTDAKTKPANSK